MQAIEIFLNKFLIFKVIYLTIYGNGLKLVMVFSPSRSIFQVKLSPRELLEISQEISRNYSPAASAVFTAKLRLSPTEMLEISKEISRKYTLKISTGTPELVLLPVDPEHLYAYWNPGRAKTPSISIDNSHEMVLRIYLQPDKNTSTTTPKSWFDVVIDNSRTQKKVLLPMQGNASAYSAAIGKRYPSDHLVPLATSNVVHVPRVSRASYQCGEEAIISGTMPRALLSSQEQSHYTSKNASGQGK
ncbi:MAG: DUF4912 domain-containing protein [Methylobacter sp.]